MIYFKIVLHHIILSHGYDLVNNLIGQGGKKGVWSKTDRFDSFLSHIWAQREILSILKGNRGVRGCDPPSIICTSNNKRSYTFDI